MGINGLLRNLHPLLVPPPTHHTNRNTDTNTPTVKIRHNIQQFASKSLAIDASSWLFKSAYTCSERLVEATEKGVRDPIAEQKYATYMISRCRELIQRAKIAQIHLVFDGIRVPLKADTNAERESKRRVHLAEARRLISMGRREEARERYNKCVKGTEEMARVVCAEVEKVFGRGDGAKVKCVFSPYEADAQLAKLCIDGICHAVVTEVRLFHLYFYIAHIYQQLIVCLFSCYFLGFGCTCL
jgi:exonuclease-1